MKSKVSKEFGRKPAEFFKNSSWEFLENERSRTVIERGFVEQLVSKGVENPITKTVDKEVAAQKPVEILNYTSDKFLENERYYTLAERGVINKNISYNAEKLNGTQIEESRQKSSIVSETQQRFEYSGGSSKRYVTTCYFQPKQIPVSYSETMILHIGSSKKKFFESVYYKNKLLPYKWSESMYTSIKGDNGIILKKSEVTIPFDQSIHHYMSLEPQQKMAENVSVV